jgi:hypothetical protein
MDHCEENAHFNHAHGKCFCNDGFDMNLSNDCVASGTDGDCKEN